MEKNMKSLDVNLYRNFFDVVTSRVGMERRIADLKELHIPYVVGNGSCRVDFGNKDAALVFTDNSVHFYLKGKEVLRGLEYTYCSTRACVEILKRFEIGICWEEDEVQIEYSSGWQCSAEGVLKAEQSRIEDLKKWVWNHIEDDYNKEWRHKCEKIESVYKNILNTMFGSRLGNYRLNCETTPYDGLHVIFSMEDKEKCVWDYLPMIFASFSNSQEFNDLVETLNEYLTTGGVDHERMATRPKVVVFDMATRNEISLMIKRHADADQTYWRGMWKNLNEFFSEWWSVLSDTHDEVNDSYERSYFLTMMFYNDDGKLKGKWRSFCESVMRKVWDELQRDIVRPVDVYPYVSNFLQYRHVKCDKLRYKGLYVFCTPYLKEGLNLQLKWKNNNKMWEFF